jgi:hypothetical protein
MEGGERMTACENKEVWTRRKSEEIGRTKGEGRGLLMQ